MKHLCIAVIALLPLSVAQSADIDAGKAKAAVCAACHGANGVSVIPDYPNLAGQKQKYLKTAITAYRDGERKNGIMSPLAKPLSDEDIANLAAYFAN